MNRFIITFIILLFFIPTTAVYGTVTISGSNGVNGAAYTLNTAFAALNGTSQTGKNITLKITASETLTSTAELNGAAGMWKSLTIYPTGNYTISGAITNGPLITLNGAGHMVMNGSLGGSGGTTNLLISNTGGAAFMISGSATDNCLRYVSLKASGSSTSVINFPQESANNDRDTIQYCNVTSISGQTRPFCGISITGSSSATYNGLTIVGNNLYDIWNPNTTSYGVYFNLGGTFSGLNISGNSLYETTDFKPTGTYNYYGIYGQNQSSNNYIFSGNYFGGSAPICGGSTMRIDQSPSSYNPIYLYINTDSNKTSLIQGNVIANISVNTASTTVFTGIYIPVGTVNITGNVIGSSTGTGNITLTATGSDCTSYGIYVNQGSGTTISNNIVGSVTAANTSGSGHSFYGIYQTGWVQGALTISGNQIGSTVTSNSIQCTSIANNHTQQLVGISAFSGIGNTVSGNTVGNLTNFSTDNDANDFIYGIYINGNGTNLIDHNFVMALNAAFTSPNSVLAGLYIVQGSNTTSDNIVYLGKNNTSGAFSIYGIADFNDSGGNGYYYYNTIYITGTVTGISAANTSAYYKATYGEHAYLTNNIFDNDRIGTNSGSGVNTAFSIQYQYSTDLITSNYNDLYVSSSSPNSHLGLLGTTVGNSISTWAAISGGDNNSLSVNPGFIIEVPPVATDFIPTVSLTGTKLAGTDFGYVIRPVIPTMGAWEMVTSVYTWTGNIDTAWNKTGNWSLNIVPTLTKSAIIPKRANNPQINNGIAAVAKSLFIYSGAVVTINGGGSLTVADSIQNLAGSAGLVVNSTSDGTGSLIYNYTTSTDSATVNRYIDGDPAAWHFLSTPVSGQQIYSTPWTPSGSYGDSTGYDLYVWNEPSSCWIYNLNKTVAPTWASVNPQGSFIPGRGYLYAVLGSLPTKQFFGILNNGVVSNSVTASATIDSIKGFNLLGNPYPSSIDWKASGFTRNMLTANTANGGGYDMWIWNSTANNYGVYNSNNSTNYGTNSVTRYIAPMQGFFVLASSTGTFQFSNAARVHNNASNWYLRDAETDVPTNCIKLNLSSESGAGSDEINLDFGYTSNDIGSLKLFSPVRTAPSLYAPSGKQFYTVRYLTDTIDNPTTAVCFKAGVNGNYKLKCTADESFGKVYLEDTQTGLIHDFNASDTYLFTASTRDAATRFVLHYGPVSSKALAREAGVYVSSGNLIIDLSLLNGQFQAQVVDLSGRILCGITLTGGERFSYPLKSRGLYLVTLQSVSTKSNFKITY